MTAVLISCYYITQNKYNSDAYLPWIDNFMAATSMTQVVIYGDVTSLHFLTSRYPSNARRHYILRPLTEFYTTRWDWTVDYHQDSEKTIGHNVSLYKIWNEKVYMVRDAIKYKVFGEAASALYLWCDIGCFRTPFVPRFLSFPNITKITPPDKVHFLEMEPLPNLPTTTPVSNRFQHKVTVGGGIFAGNAQAIGRFAQLHTTILDEATRTNTFKGKDQNMFAFCILRHPTWFKLWSPTPSTLWNPWLSLQYWWAVEHPYNATTAVPNPTAKQTPNPTAKQHQTPPSNKHQTPTAKQTIGRLQR